MNTHTITRRRYVKRTLMTGATIATLVVLGACAGTPTSNAGTSSSTQPTTQPSAPPGTVGTIAAINGNQLEVQNPANGQVTVIFTSSTAFTQTIPATSKDLSNGVCVSVSEPRSTDSGSNTPNPTPTATTGPITAGTVRIFQPVSGTCTNPQGFGGFRGAGGFGRRPRGTFSPRPGGGFRRNANGKASSVTSTSMVVSGVDRRTGAAMTTNIALVPSTTYTKVVKATSAALLVGKCVAALGASNDTGAITATTISISTPGANGCFGGFGGGGGGNG